MSALVARLLEHGNDAPIDGALDHLYQTNLGAYDTLIELVENESESVVDDAGRPRVAGAAHRRARSWRGPSTRFPPGAIARDDADTLRVQLQAHVLAAGRARDARALPLFDRPAAAPLLGAAPPRRAPRRRRHHGRGAAPRARAPAGDRAPARRHALPRRVRRGAARAGALPLAGGRLGPRRAARAASSSGSRRRARRSRKLLPGCVFECLLPDAYYVNCRESDRRVRPFGIRAAVAFLENALEGQGRRPAGGGRRLRRGARRRVPRRASRSATRPRSRTASCGRSTAARTRPRAPARSTR